ncbi:hypothetical protein [Paenibacillus sp. USHLN196]|uniref:hypothetical protein n=1 Tax=Paenibacillus sp. USHLN196 TaxID=3081291 RepID=UPI0030171A7C
MKSKPPKNQRNKAKGKSKAGVMIAIVAGLSLLLSGCGGGDDIKFEFKVQEKYSGQFISEEAARLLDYLTLATEI